MADSDFVVIFTDGACSGNPGPGGWAAVLVSPLGKVRELGGFAAETTNNRMELTAALEALTSLTNVKKLSTRNVKIYSDSVYLIKGITVWVHGWMKNGWKTSDGNEVSNKDIWELLFAKVKESELKIEWLYVPAHRGYPGNERCDEIAVAFSKIQKVKLFQGNKSDYGLNLEKLPPPKTLPDAKHKKQIPIYLSFVDGRLYRDKDWKDCEVRVRGVPGAKFKKVESDEEERLQIEEWGAR